jgi:hypothetical protein
MTDFDFEITTDYSMFSEKQRLEEEIKNVKKKLAKTQEILDDVTAPQSCIFVSGMTTQEIESLRNDFSKHLTYLLKKFSNN